MGTGTGSGGCPFLGRMGTGISGKKTGFDKSPGPAPADRGDAPALQDQQQTWEKIQESISIANQHKPVSGRLVPMPDLPRSKKSRLRRWMPYAAILTGVLIATYAIFLFYGAGTVRYATVMGEQKTIELPDHSVVRLNVNSTLHFDKNWNKKGPREVWLRGEAYFTVHHEQDNRQFIVHTNDVNIQVVGTEFNVNTRRVQTQVVLNNGVVQLTLKQSGSKSQAPITMKPGDMVTYSAATASLTNKRVNPDEYASWRRRVLIFNDAPVTEVIKSLQDNLGIIIQLKDESIGRQTFTGNISIDDIKVFFKTLERSFNIHIEQTGENTYVISSIQG